ARGDDALADDLPDDRGVHPHVQRTDGRHGARVFVAAGDVVEEVAGGAHAQPRQRLGALGPDALEVLRGGVQRRESLRRRHTHREGYAVRTSRANSSASKVSRSSTPSPTPISFTGRPNSCFSATTMPPLAVLSSLASTSPESFSAWPKSRA